VRGPESVTPGPSAFGYHTGVRQGYERAEGYGGELYDCGRVVAGRAVPRAPEGARTHTSEGAANAATDPTGPRIGTRLGHPPHGPEKPRGGPRPQTDTQPVHPPRAWGTA